MRIETKETPEQKWEEVKAKVFKNGAPKDIDAMMKKGFDESEDEQEKWMKLGAFMAMIKQKFGNIA